MRNLALIAVFVSATLALAAEKNQNQASKKATAKPGEKTIVLRNSEGKRVGTATLSYGRKPPTFTGKATRIKLDVTGLPAGEHAIHLHEAAKCDPPDFKTAGAHFNPTHKKHGLENPEGHHAGDMKNIKVNDDGALRDTVYDSDVTLGGGGANSLFAKGGTSLVIHAKPDDMKTDPSGNSGDRIACGVIRK
jgi:superoxide dismutase, Cu-Zn family